MRDELAPAFRDQASQRICERMQQWSAFQSATVVSAYLPMRGEVDLWPLIVGVPNIRWAIRRLADAPVRHLFFHVYHPEHLVPHRIGMLEPDPATLQVASDQAGLILVPGLAFTPLGDRLAVAVDPTTACWRRPATPRRWAPASRRCCSTRSLMSPTTCPWITW